MHYRVTHTTTYDYAAPVTVSHHVARLQPRLTPAQRELDFSLEITPEPSVRNFHTDYFGNRVCFFSIEQLHTKLEVTARSAVEVTPEAQPALEVSPPWETVAAMFRDPVSPAVAEAYQFVFDSPLLSISPALADYARQSFTPGTPLLVGARDLTARIHRDFKFDPTATTVSTPLAEVFEQRSGVCQDFAHLAIACIRSLGLAARYVSGYLLTDPPPGKPRLVGADASHAWFAIYCPHLGFIDFDPTNNCLPAERHVTPPSVATSAKSARSPASSPAAAPLSSRSPSASSPRDFAPDGGAGSPSRPEFPRATLPGHRWSPPVPPTLLRTHNTRLHAPPPSPHPPRFKIPHEAPRHPSHALRLRRTGQRQLQRSAPAAHLLRRSEL